MENWLELKINAIKYYTEGTLWESLKTIGRWLIRWEVIVWGTAILLPSGISAMFAGEFALATILYVVTAVWFVSRLLFFEKQITYSLRRLKESGLIVLGVAIVLGLFLYWNSYAMKKQTESAPPKLTGWLIPGHKPTPDKKCLTADEGSHTIKGAETLQISEDHLALFFGDNVSVEKTFPRTLIEFRDKPLLTLYKNEKDGLAISFDIYDSTPNPRIIARVEHNNFITNPNNYFDSRLSEGGSRLEITDQQGIKVLDIEYLNSQAMLLKGAIRIPGMPTPLIIGDDSITWNTMKRFSGNCMSDDSTAFVAIDIFPTIRRPAGVTLAY